LALIAFAAAILAGVWANNDLPTVLVRAWWALILFLILGALIGWMAKAVLDEHVRQAVEPIADEAPPPPVTPSGSPTTGTGRVG
jgi:hypothetical protein